MPRIRFIDGFDHVREDSIRLKYNGYNAIFDQASNQPGYLGQSSYFLQNVAFWEANYTQILDSQQTWIFGAWLQPKSAMDDIAIFRIEDGSAASTQISLSYTAAGTIKVRRGGNGSNGSGTILAESAETFPIDVWNHIEVKVRIAAAGTVDVLKNGESILHYAGNTQATVHASADRVTFRLQNTGRGYAIDHYFIADNDNGATDANFLGPARVETRWPNGDEINFWSRSSGSSSYQLVDDFIRANQLGRPTTSGDDGYIVASTPSDDLYDFQSTVCFGLIYALAITAAVRSTGVSTNLSGLWRQGVTAYQLGSARAAAVSSAYQILQWPANANPITLAGWKDRDINDSIIGIRSHGSGPVRCTQLVIEKLASISKPGDCGRGSYAY